MITPSLAICNAKNKQAPSHSPRKHEGYFRSLLSYPSVPASGLDLDEEGILSEADLEEHITILSGREIKPLPRARPRLGYPKTHNTFLQQFKDISQSSPSKRQHRRASSRNSDLKPEPAAPKPLSESSPSSNFLSYSSVSSWSPSRTNRPQISVSGLVSPSRSPSPESSSRNLQFSTPAPTRSAKSNLLTPDSTHLGPKSRQLGDASPRLVFRLNRSQSPDIKPSPVELTGLFTPEPTPEREKLQCQGLTGEKIQCKKWKTETGGAVYFCNLHQAQAGSPLHERLARAREEELVRSNQPGQCQGLNRRRVQCRSPAITESSAFRGFCDSHRDQQVPGRPEPPSLESRRETDTNNEDTFRGTSAPAPPLEDEKPGRAIRTHVEAVEQGCRAGSIGVEQCLKRSSGGTVSRDEFEDSTLPESHNQARPAVCNTPLGRVRGRCVSNVRQTSPPPLSERMFPSARPRSSSSPGSRPITSIKSPLPSPSGLLPPLPTFSRTTSSGFFHPEWPQSDLELHSKLNAYIRDGGERFRDYIPSYLTNDTKRKLVDYMEQKSTQIAVSQGYIYAHKVSSKSGAEHMWIKVGCSIHPDRRFGQWRRDCPKSYFEPRGVWPNNNAPGKLTTDKKDLARMPQFKYVLEGLIKIELQDLAQESSHLQERLEPPLPSKSCCGKKHTEIFAIGRYSGGDEDEDDKKIWELVDAVIRRWIRFVALYVREG